MLGLWDGGGFHQHNIYYADEEELLRIYLSDLPGSSGMRFYRISREAKNTLPLVAFYLSKTRNLKLSPSLLPEVEDLRKWYLTWQDYVFGKINKCSIERSPCDVISIWQPIISEFIEKYTILLNATSYSSVILGVEAKQFSGAWWRSCKNLLELVRESRGTLERIGRSSDYFVRLTELLSSVSDLLNDLENGDITGKHYVLSALSFSMASKRLEAGDSDPGFLLLHRAIDFCVQGYAIEVGQVAADDARLRYTDKKFNSEKVSLAFTYKVLKEAGEMALSHELDFYLGRVNNIRNNLLLTHSAYTLSFAEANDYKGKVYSLARGVCSKEAKWRAAVTAFNAVRPISPWIVIDACCVDSYYSEVEFLST